MRIRLITLGIVLLFGMTIAYFCYSVYFYGGRWVANPYNPRINNQKKYVTMGTVTDRTGTRLAWTNEEGERCYHRNQEIRMAVSQVVGDNQGRVSTGVDTFHAQYLLGFKAGLLERLSDAFLGKTQRGDDLELTISASLSQYISKHFPEDRKGAVVVMNYRTGEILAMVSKPQFDPVNLTEILENEESSALINRATQGLYPPGSTFKVVTLASALENLPDLEDFVFECTGYYPVGSYSVTENTAHGVLDLSGAFSKSCNTAFAALSQDLGYEKLGRTAERLGFNENFMYDDLIIYNSSYPIDDLSPEDLAWSSIGQGRVLATPMHMALITCAVANDGRMPTPHLLKRILTPQGGERSLQASYTSRSVLSGTTAARIQQEMIQVVRNGTGTRAAISGVTVAGKTGTAEASNDKSVGAHAWFVGYVTDAAKPYAVCVLVENGGSGGSVAAPLARRALQKAIELEL